MPPATASRVTRTRLDMSRPFVTIYIKLKFFINLIKNTTQNTGPCPVVKVGEFSNQFQLRFDCKTLKEGPSAQLSTVADLCVSGEAKVKAMSGTVLFNVLTPLPKTDEYDIQVLTLMTTANGAVVPPSTEAPHITQGEYSGIAGHVAITYKYVILLKSCCS